MRRFQDSFFKKLKLTVYTAECHFNNWLRFGKLYYKQVHLEKKKKEEGIRHELTPGRRDWDCGVRAGMFLFSHFYFLWKVESKVITSEKRDEQAMLEV